MSEQDRPEISVKMIGLEPIGDAMSEGIDASYYQGQIDWAKVAKAGQRFAIIRSGDGKFLDPKFGPYIRGALDNGLHVTIYHYLRFGLDPESHADLCARRLQEAQELGARDFLWLDWEDISAQAKAMTVLQRQQWASEFLDSLEKNNDIFTYGHYTGTWWFGPNLGTPSSRRWDKLHQFFDRPLWIGQYPYGAQSDPTLAGWSPKLPPNWPDWQVWQYTSSGRVDGIEGNVDLDIAREGFLDLKEEDMDIAGVRLEIKRLLGYEPQADDKVITGDQAKMRVETLSVLPLVGHALAGEWGAVNRIMRFYGWDKITQDE